MKNIPLVDLKAQYKNIKCDIDEAIKAVLTDTNFIMGQQVSDFENLFSEFHASVYSIGVSSGTDR
jgi:dTDP-4-amino-4,6-dideoxygalactose transaminase